MDHSGRGVENGLLAAIVRCADEAILSVALDGVITSWSPAAERLYGYGADAVLGKPITMLLPGDGSEMAEVLRRIADGHSVDRRPMRHVRSDGTEVSVSITVAPLVDERGTVVGACALARDADGSLGGEPAEAGARWRDLRAARDRAESASRAKSEFLARMSHELRTPLNAIIGFGQLLELEELEPRQREEVGYILKAGGHLLELVNEVLELARIESGQMTVSPEPVALADTVREALALVAPMAREHGVSLHSDTAALADDGHVYADRNRFKQVLLNLLSNAIKYNRRDGRVEVAFEITAEGRVRTIIADTGIGIQPEHVAKLFEPFERLDAENTTVEGTGLGLALSKGLIEAMEGTITVASRAGVGTTFTIELGPAAQPAGEPRQLRSERTAAALGSPGGGQQLILYVEDNLSNLKLMERIIARQPTARLLPAMQGGLGLDLARQHHPDLIVLDLHLPDMPGTEVLKRLKAEPSTRGIPVMVLTADATKGQAEQLQRLGASHFMTKPIDIPMFLAVIAETLAERADRGT